jgi:hypothetical protein
MKETWKDETFFYEKGYDKLYEDGRDIHFSNSHSRHVHPIYRKGKAGKFPCANGNSILQYSFEQEKSYDWPFLERNEEAETYSNKSMLKLQLIHKIDFMNLEWNI